MKWKTETLPVSKLQEWKGNPRTISDEDLEELKRSFEEFEQARTLTVNPIGKGKYEIIGGNQSLRALRELGYKQIQCSIPDKALTETQKRKLSIVLNHRDKGEGEWNFDILRTWEDIDLEALGVEFPGDFDETANVREDNYKVPKEIDTDIEPGDLIELTSGTITHRLICGDCRDQETMTKLLQGTKVDLVVTDPPYNVDYEGGTGMKIENDKMTPEKYADFMTKSYKAMHKAMRPGAAIYVWHADTERSTITRTFQEAGLYLSGVLIWVKNSLVMGRSDYQWRHEPCLYGWKPGASHFFINDRSNTTVIDDRPAYHKMKKPELLKVIAELTLEREKQTVIYHDKPSRSELHPTMKPILLIAELIKNSSKPMQTVLDPFVGSGTTMVTGHQLTRPVFACELDPKFCEVTIHRMRLQDDKIQVTRNGQPYTPKL